MKKIMIRNVLLTVSRCLVAAGLSVIMVTNAMGAQTASNYKTAYRYNKMGQLTGTISSDPDGSGSLRALATRNKYNSSGYVESEEHGYLNAFHNETISPNSWSGFVVVSKKVMTYDDLGRMKTNATTTPTGTIRSLTQYSYNGDNQVECMTVRMNPAVYNNLPASACSLGTEGNDGPDRVTRYTYGSQGLGEVTKEERGVGTSDAQVYAEYDYNSDHLVEGITDANGNYTRQTYDGWGRLAYRYYPSKTSTGSHNTSDYIKYTYDNVGNVKSERKRKGTTILFTYDDLNRMTKKDLPGTPSDVYYSYDHPGNTLTAKFTSHAGAGITNQYNGFGELKASTTTMAGTRTISYRYDKTGNLTRITHPDNKYFTYAHDYLDRYTTLKESASTTVASYQYYTNGNPKSLTRTSGVVTTYDYDDVSRLDDIIHNVSGSNYDVNYDFTFTPSNQVKTRTTSNDFYVYDDYTTGTTSYTPNGLNQYENVGGVTHSYDTNANLQSDGTSTYTYDEENRLTSVAGAKSAQFKYDPLGRLYEYISRGSTTRFVYDGDQLMLEYNTSGSIVKRYVFGDGTDKPIIEYSGSSVGSSNEVF